MPERSDPPDLSTLRIAVLGGTGAQGRGLARRWAAAGLEVLIGSRDAERAQRAAESVGASSGTDNETAAREADVVVVVVPWDGHAELLTDLKDALAGKVVVDCVNPLGFDGQGPYALPVPEGSAAQQAQSILTDSHVVGAFHNVSAVHLDDPELREVGTDVLVLGEDREATDLVQELAGMIPGMRGIYAGRLRNAPQIEALTANLIAINRRYKAHAGIRITDI